MSPEREKIVRDFVKRYDQWPRSTWKNQDYMRELLEEIDSLRRDALELLESYDSDYLDGAPISEDLRKRVKKYANL